MGLASPPPIEILIPRLSSPDASTRWRAVKDLATGGLESPSYSVLVSATGLGFVGVEEWWGLGYGNSVTIVKADGGPPVTCRLRDLFTVQETAAFSRSSSSIWWLRGAWLDDEARKVVLVASNGKVRTVAWGDGAIGKGTDADVMRALALPYEDAKQLALELVAERGIAAAKPALTMLHGDATETMEVRLRAAVALANLGDLAGKATILAQAAEGEDYAIAALPAVLGNDSIPLLIDWLGTESSGAHRGLARLGTAGVPALIALLTREASGPAAEVLLEIGDRRAVLPLLRAATTDDGWDAKTFVSNAIALSDDEIGPEIAFLIENRLLSVLRELGHEELCVGDEWGDERDLVPIPSLIEGDLVPYHGTLYTDDHSLLVTTHWDSHYSFLCGSKSRIEEILRIDPFEGFFCTPKTHVYWGVNGV